MSNWTHFGGDFSRRLTDVPTDAILERMEIYKNLSGSSSIKEICLLGDKDGGIRIHLNTRDKTAAAAFLTHFKSIFPSIHCDEDILKERVWIELGAPGSQQKQDLNRTLEAINSFEPIEPLATFVRMKKALGLELAESIEVYVTQVQSFYAEGKFDAALALALRCKEAGMPGLAHGLAQHCLEANDYENLTKVISHESDSSSIYDFAFQIFTADQVDGIGSSREKLKVAMKLFDLCGSLKDALRLKTQIFAELTGKSFDRAFVELAIHLHGDNLCQVADVLFVQNREIDKLKAVAGNASHHAVSSTVMHGFSGGSSAAASDVARRDASTQTNKGDSGPT